MAAKLNLKPCSCQPYIEVFGDRLLPEDCPREDLGGVESQVVDWSEGEQGRNVLLDLEKSVLINDADVRNSEPSLIHNSRFYKT